ACCDGIYSNAGSHMRFQNVEVKNAAYQNIHLDPNSGGYFEFINVNSHNSGRLYDGIYEDHGAYISASNNLFDGGSYYDNPYGNGIQLYPGANANNNIVRNVSFYNNHTA